MFIGLQWRVVTLQVNVRIEAFEVVIAMRLVGRLAWQKVVAQIAV
jgi:hypothetical protein